MSRNSQRKKFYAVRAGHRPGVYGTWEECEAQVVGYPKAQFKGFPTLADAETFLTDSQQPRVSPGTPAQAPSVPFDSAPDNTKDASLKSVVIYTDGACIGNPGPGGYGVVLIHGERRKELSAGFRLTTNNRMEILGCIAGLQTLKEPCEVKIYSDSKYVVNTMTKSWALRWRTLGWKRKDETGQLKDA